MCYPTRLVWATDIHPLGALGSHAQRMPKGIPAKAGELGRLSTSFCLVKVCF